MRKPQTAIGKGNKMKVANFFVSLGIATGSVFLRSELVRSQENFVVTPLNSQTLALTDAARALLGPNTSFLPSLYSSPSLEAWIVDADTKQPVQGVVVAASWQSELHTYGGRSQGEMVRMMEAVTDVHGHFYFPAWGPVLVKQGHVEEDSPKLVLFKPRYKFQTLFSEKGHGLGAGYRAEWNGTRIKLKYIGIADLKQLDDLTSTLNYVVEKGEECRWRLAEKMILAIREARLELSANGQSTIAWRTLDQQIIAGGDSFAKAGGPGCENPKILLPKESK